MENLLIIIGAILIFIESAVLIVPYFLKNKEKSTAEIPPITRQYIKDNQATVENTTTTAENFQSQSIVIDEASLDNFDSRPLISNHLGSIQNERNSPVYMVKNESEEELGYNIIKELDPDIDPKKPILIKPNLGGFVSIRKGEDNGVTNRTTSPVFVKGIIRYLKEKGAQDIAIGESWGVTKPEMVQELFRISGFQKMADEAGVKMIDLNYYNDGNPDNYPVKIEYPQAKLLKDDIYVSKTYLKYLAQGTIINVPKLKTHRYSVTSLSLKNLMGVLMMHGESPYLQANKSRMHRDINEWFLKANENNAEQIEKYVLSYKMFSERLTDLYVAVKPDFTIIDGYIGTEGDGFDKIKTRAEHVAFASKNQVYADYAASSYMGFVGSDRLKDNFGFDKPIYLEESLARFYKEVVADKDIKIINKADIQAGLPFLITPMVGSRL